jgi:hypothetical protein
MFVTGIDQRVCGSSQQAHLYVPYAAPQVAQVVDQGPAVIFQEEAVRTAATEHAGEAQQLKEQEEEVEEGQKCCICMESRKNTALGCGHVLCRGCAYSVSRCPLCKKAVGLRLKLYL